MKSGFFVTGTDTGIGKTLCSAVLTSAFMQQDKKVSYWKPIQTGDDSDRDTVLSLSGLAGEHAPLPCYWYPEPMAPARAAKLHGDLISLSTIQSRWHEFPSDRLWIVEGVGGLLVPIAEQDTVADLVRELDLPLVIAASPRLGGMNHFLLTLEAAQIRELPISGVIWVGGEDPEIEKSLEDWFVDIPWIQRIPQLSPLDQTQVHRAAKGLKCF